jgi:hypothetical protein
MSVVLLVGEAGYVTPQRIRVRDRVSARVRSSRLDSALARGVAPESSAALELRAQALIGPVARRLGELLREIVASAHARERLARAPVPISVSLVLESESELSALAERLLGGGPVAARGVARLRELLCDGGGPLYGRSPDAGQLRAALDAALEALEVDG